MDLADLLTTPTVLLWAAILVPFGMRYSAAVWLPWMRPWLRTESRSPEDERSLRTRPVHETARLLVAAAIASVLITFLAPWINALPIAQGVAWVAFIGSAGAAVLWFFLRIRDEDRRRIEAAAGYRSTGYPPES